MYIKFIFDKWRRILLYGKHRFSNRRIAQQLIEMFEAGSKDLRELGARAIGLESHIQVGYHLKIVSLL